MDDIFLQKELSNIKESEQTLGKFHQEAMNAESRRQHYQDTAEKGNILDASSSVTINKFGNSGNRGHNVRGSHRQMSHGSNNNSQGNYSHGTQPHSNTAPTTAPHASNYGRGGRGRGYPVRPVSNYGQPKRTLTCHNCGIVGHHANYCPDQQNKQSKKNQYQHRRYHQSRNAGANKTSIENSQEDDNSYKKMTVNEESPITTFKVEIENSCNPRVCAAVTASATTNASSIEHDIGIKASSAGDSFLPHMMAGIILNGNFKCEMEVDTAADHCIITQKLFDEIVSKSENNPPLLQKSSVTMKLADGSPSNSIKGSTLMKIARADMPDKTCIFPAFVVDGPHTLLGRPALCELWPKQYDNWSKAANCSINALRKLPMKPNVATSSGDHQTIHSDEFTAATTNIPVSTMECVVSTQQPHPLTTRPFPPPPTGEITQEMGEAYCKRLCDEVYPELFSKGQGKFKGVKAKLYIKEGHEKFMKVMPPAKVPHGIKHEYEKELDKMYDGRGLIVASQIVPVMRNKEGKGKIRLCINYKRTLNDHLEDEWYPFPTCNDQIDKLKGEHYSCLDVKGAFTHIEVDPPSRT